jgi:ElaA protein
MSNIVWKIKTFDEFTVPELYAVLKARIDVFVIEQNCPYPDLDNYDQKAVHIWAEEDGEVLANCRFSTKE